MEAVEGKTCTRIPESMVIAKVTKAFARMQLVATISSEAGDETVAGAVYSPVGVIVPNPAIGFITLGMLHPAGPCPAVHIVGGIVVEGTPGGSQICQKTVAVETPVTVAVNWAGLFTMIASGGSPGPVMVMPTLVEFPPHPATHAARSKTAANPHALMCMPPTISPGLPACFLPVPHV